MTGHDRLEAILHDGRWGELEPWLRASADSAQGKELRSWYRSRRGHWAKEFQWQSSRHAEDIDHPGCLRLLAVALDPPDRAARRVSQASWGWQTAGSDRALVALAASRGAEWCQAFLDAAAEVKVSKGDEHAVAWVAFVGRELVREGLATLPRTPTMATAWAAAYSQGASLAKWRSWRIQQGQDVGVEGPSLTDLLREDPALADGVSLLLSGPGAMGMLEYYLGRGWDLAESAATLVDDGLLDRSRLLEDTFAALTRQDNANTQKGLARLLTGLRLSGEDLCERIPLAQGLLATSRGSVTAALLPPFLDAAGPDDLVELARTVFSRKEKAQQKLLLAALVAPGAVDRWDRQSVVAGLGVATEVPDARLAERATTALAKLGESAPDAAPEAPMDGLWAPPPAATEADEVDPVEPDARGLTAAASGFGDHVSAAYAALFTDAFVRWYAVDARAAQQWTATARASTPVFLPALVQTILHGTQPVTVEMLRKHSELVSTHLHTGKRPSYEDVGWSVFSRSATGALHDGVTYETTIRLGTIPSLLSTPTHSDGSLTYDALVTRLRAYPVPVGPLDLVLALLRLQPVDPARAADLAGLSVPLWSTEKPGFLRRRRTADAIDTVRAWVTQGGLAPLTIRHRGSQVVVDPSPLPAGVGDIPGVPGAIASGHDPGKHDEYYEWDVSVESGPGIVPLWADLMAARMQRQFDQTQRATPRWLSQLADSPAPGLATQHAVAQTLCHAGEDRRLLAVEVALHLMGRGVWSSGGYTECCLHQLADGELRLARLSHSWEQIVLGGGLQPLWPTVLAVLDAACALDRKPAGLAELLAVVRRYARAVPDVRLPDAVQALARSGGSSKAKLEAKALVEAVR